MENSAVNESPIACKLTALTTEQRVRRQALAQQARNVTQEIRELPDGYAFRYPADSALCLTIAEFMTLERLCCPFFSFTLELEREDGPLWLRITGREGVKQFLRAELGLK